MFGFTKIKLGVVVLHLCTYVWEAVWDLIWDWQFIWGKRQVQLGVICIPALWKTRWPQRAHIHGKEQQLQHQCLGDPSGELVRSCDAVMNEAKESAVRLAPGWGGGLQQGFKGVGKQLLCSSDARRQGGQQRLVALKIFRWTGFVLFSLCCSEFGTQCWEGIMQLLLSLGRLSRQGGWRAQTIQEWPQGGAIFYFILNEIIYTYAFKLLKRAMVGLGHGIQAALSFGNMKMNPKSEWKINSFQQCSHKFARTHHKSYYWFVAATWLLYPGPRHLVVES